MGSISCPLCHKQFVKNCTLNRHIRSVHNCQVAKIKKRTDNFKCVICSDCCEDSKSFANHIYEKHDIVIKKEKLNFASAEEFYNWKNKTEDQENSFYIKLRTSNKPKKWKTLEYACNRSGVYVPKVIESERKRQIKVQGSSKISGFCPAGIKAIFKEDGSVSIEYRATHVGHSTELVHLHLKLEQREQIANKIAMKVPFDQILDEIRSSTNSGIKRKHLITKQDLCNIEKEFSLDKEAVHHSSDAVSVEAWVQKERAGENNCILLYKPQGVCIEEYSQLDEGVFALGIMTNAQAHILRKFSSDYICVDSTGGSDSRDFEVTTIVVLDDTRLAFPCAFFISNKTNLECIKMFFNAVKTQVGIINCNVFMSDVGDLFYTAWESVMGKPNNRFFCTWHVDRDWRNNLSKVKDTNEQKATYKTLRALMEETDQVEFLKKFSSISLNLCMDEKTKEFGNYFYTNYGCCYESWACCFRPNLNSNTENDLERMHRTIKHLYLKAKSLKQLDKAVYATMQMVKSKVFDRLIVLEKVEFATELKELRSRHILSLKMNPDRVVPKGEGCWEIVSSSKKNLVYTIRQVNDNCDCCMRCKQCSACVHRYTCTCIDSCIKWNMCKHVHLVCRILNSNPTDNSIQYIEQEQQPSEITGKTFLIVEENDAILKEVDCVVEISSIETEKQLLREKFELLLNNVSTAAEIEVVSKAIRNTAERLNALKEETVSRVPAMEIDNAQSNKNIQHQKTLLTTRTFRKISLGDILKGK